MLAHLSSFVFFICFRWRNVPKQISFFTISATFSSLWIRSRSVFKRNVFVPICSSVLFVLLYITNSKRSGEVSMFCRSKRVVVVSVYTVVSGCCLLTYTHNTKARAFDQISNNHPQLKLYITQELSVHSRAFLSLLFVYCFSSLL